MWNMIPEEIDVTEYVKSGEYKIDSCGGRIDKLIRVMPKKPYKNFDSFTFEKAKIFFTSLKKNETIEKVELLKKTKYIYTYFIAYKPIDVYETRILVDKKETKIYIRANEKGDFIDNYSETKWVTNECEWKN